MSIFSCFRVFLPSKWLQNKIEPITPGDGIEECSKCPWKSLISTSYSIISWDAASTYKQENEVITKPGGLSFRVGLKDGAFTIPTLPPRKLPPIKREEIASLKQPKIVERKNKGKESHRHMSVDEKIEKAKIRRQNAESERKAKTLKKLGMLFSE